MLPFSAEASGEVASELAASGADGLLMSQHQHAHGAQRRAA